MPPQRGLGREADRVRRVRTKSVCQWMCAHKRRSDHILSWHAELELKVISKWLSQERGNSCDTEREVPVKKYSRTQAHVWTLTVELDGVRLGDSGKRIILKPVQMSCKNCNTEICKARVIIHSKQCWTFADPTGRFSEWLLPHECLSVGGRTKAAVGVWYVARELYSAACNCEISSSVTTVRMLMPLKCEELVKRAVSYAVKQKWLTQCF